jgi:hypothetical protein
MSISVLNSLVSTSPFFNSHEILIHWMTKCRQLVDQLAEILRNTSLSDLLEKIEDKDYAFLARCTNFRLAMKKIEREINSPMVSKQSLYESYNYLLSTFQPFCNVGRMSRELVLDKIGYDFAHSLTGPYPLFVSLFDHEVESSIETAPIRNLFLHESGFLESNYLLGNFSSNEVTSLRVALEELNTLSPFLLCDITMNVRLFAKIIPQTDEVDSIQMSLTTSYLPGVCFF